MRGDVPVVGCLILLMIKSCSKMSSESEWIITLGQSDCIYILHQVPYIPGPFVSWMDNGDNVIVKQQEMLKHGLRCLLVMIIHETKPPRAGVVHFKPMMLSMSMSASGDSCVDERAWSLRAPDCCLRQTWSTSIEVWLRRLGCSSQNDNQFIPMPFGREHAREWCSFRSVISLLEQHHSDDQFGQEQFFFIWNIWIFCNSL